MIHNEDSRVKIPAILHLVRLGNAFYQNLINRSEIRLMDFENPENNLYHVVTELSYQKGDESFRPGITLLVNGMPLVFIEVVRVNPE